MEADASLHSRRQHWFLSASGQGTKYQSAKSAAANTIKAIRSVVGFCLGNCPRIFGQIATAVRSRTLPRWMGCLMYMLGLDELPFQDCGEEFDRMQHRAREPCLELLRA